MNDLNKMTQLESTIQELNHQLRLKDQKIEELERQLWITKQSTKILSMDRNW